MGLANNCLLVTLILIMGDTWGFAGYKDPDEENDAAEAARAAASCRDERREPAVDAAATDAADAIDSAREAIVAREAARPAEEPQRPRGRAPDGRDDSNARDGRSSSSRPRTLWSHFNLSKAKRRLEKSLSARWNLR